MLSNIKSAIKSSRYDLLIGLTSGLGALLGGIYTRPYGNTITALGSTIGALAFLITTVFFVNFFRPRYTIKGNRFKDIFLEKMTSDVNNFCDSNTSVIEANRRMKEDSKIILEFAPKYPILSKETDGLKLVSSWLEEGANRHISFVDIMDRKGLEVIASTLANQVKSEINVDILKINSSIVEPGCVALIEKLRHFGIPIEHEFIDINGIEQSRTISSEAIYSASFIPYSTIFLSRNRKSIIDKYIYLCPITWEDQMIVGKRDMYGEFSIQQVECPERGSGHYELITMMGNGILGLSSDNPIDLNKFSNKNNEQETVILYQPVAEIYREVKELNDKWGYVKNLPFPVDIILVVNEKHFGKSLNSFQSLVIVLMALMKSDKQKTLQFGNDLYNDDKYRLSFEDATSHFANILN